MKCDQNILCYKTIVRVRGKDFTFPPFEGTFEISYLSCCGILFIKSVSHPILRLKTWGLVKDLISGKNGHLSTTHEAWLKSRAPSAGPSRSLPDLN